MYPPTTHTDNKSLIYRPKAPTATTVSYYIHIHTYIGYCCCCCCCNPFHTTRTMIIRVSMIWWWWWYRGVNSVTVFANHRTIKLSSFVLLGFQWDFFLSFWESKKIMLLHSIVLLSTKKVIVWYILWEKMGGSWSLYIYMTQHLPCR